MNKIIALILVAFLSACGGGGSDAPAEPAKIEQKATNLLFLGNSLTFMPTDATYVPGSNVWGAGGWGMAASAPDKDYAHIVSARMGLPFTAMNLSENEQNQNSALPAFTVGPGTIVVIQLGDNGLPAKYAELVQRAKVGHKLVCLTTWGDSPVLRQRDAVMRPICEAAGGKWVDITDLIFTPANVGVLGHPGDIGMAQLAERTYAAIGGVK